MSLEAFLFILYSVHVLLLLDCLICHIYLAQMLRVSSKNWDRM